MIEERCPRCRSRYIQYDNFDRSCYCLEKDCNYRWEFKGTFKNITNPYLRTSMRSNSNG